MHTTLLHPQSDGLVKWFNHTFANQLTILTNSRQQDKDQHLLLMLWAYRTAMQE